MKEDLARNRSLKLPLIFMVALSLGWAAHSPVATPLFGITAAYADDDDDDDDDGGFSGGGYYGGGDNLRPTPNRVLRVPSAQRFFRGVRRALTGQPAPRGRTAARPVELPDRAQNEIVAIGLGDAARDQLVANGYAVLEEAEVTSLDTVVVKLRIPDGSSLEAAREEVRGLAGGAQVDFNHYYRSEQAGSCSGPHCAAPRLVGWPLAGGGEATCRVDARIGIVDTGINPDHTTFEGGRLETIRLGDGELEESGLQHGTAVAALLVGGAESRTPGLLPGAQVIAIDAFHRAARQDDRSDVFTLVRAIDMALGREVVVLNMSLAGPANDLLRDAVAKASAATVVVAAVGNGGPNAAPAYPAAYDGVIGVTAVDRGRRVYRRAGRGEHVDIAAPGVEVWTAASISGGRPKTGTSFAAPFVTAAAALIRAREPELTPAEVKQRLATAAQDLGEPGKDPVFGWGLLDASGLCPADEAPVPISAGAEQD